MSFALWAGSDVIEQSQFAARWTARASFLVFLVAYTASAMARLFPGPVTKALLRRRRQWGLGFALSHTIHLAALITYLSLSGEERPLGVLIGGGLGYALMFAMALTSNDASQRMLGGWWKRLHRLGIHYIWFIFLFSYAGRLADPDRIQIGLVFTPIALAALGLRITARYKSLRRGRAATAG
ncbi:hypothetical protein D3876_09095 [Sphingomonas cavernae]|uniref:Ferric oxidoreductase domain-containing protein n=1 Tax=Sphingomonas cavernae TaxID=2320861 RepID=A0A418WK25_9SPHN|nr:hypothetical protein D3876_09095 [Sphingomonas cavernae]